MFAKTAALIREWLKTHLPQLLVGRLRPTVEPDGSHSPDGVEGAVQGSGERDRSDSGEEKGTRSSPDAPPAPTPSTPTHPPGESVNGAQTGDAAAGPNGESDGSRTANGTDPSGSKPEDPTAPPPDGTSGDQPADKPSKPPGEIRGRRPDGKTRGTPNRLAPSSPTVRDQPQLICRQRRGGEVWEVALRPGQRLPIECVEQNGSPLSERHAAWPLPSFTEPATVFPKGAERPSVLPLRAERCLIFKFGADWEGDGRRVSSLTKGHLIAIAPREWCREDDMPVAPEGCSDRRFLAHFFFLDGSESAANTVGFKEHSLDVGGAGFSLGGDLVFDDSKHGSLYVGDPPTLEVATSIVWARVGEERDAGWQGDNFRPSESSLADALKERQGRFFVRVYDENKLIDSDQFRYLQGLRELQVNGEIYTEETVLMPSREGYSSAKVRLVPRDGADLRVISPSDGDALGNAAASIDVPPDPKNDAVKVAVESGAGPVDVLLRLPRVWWRMVSAVGKPASPWRSSPYRMSRRQFRDYADSDASLRLRLPDRIARVRVGFDDEITAKYKPSQNEIRLRLADFLDHRQIDQHLSKSALLNGRLFTRRGAASSASLTLVRVAADPRPEIVRFRAIPNPVEPGEEAVLSWETRNADEVEVTVNPHIGTVDPSGETTVNPVRTTIYALRLRALGMEDVLRRVTVRVGTAHQRRMVFAAVRRGGANWRRGKGFSRRELCASGWTVPNASTSRWLRLDLRRRSAHSANIGVLRRLRND